MTEYSDYVLMTDIKMPLDYKNALLQHALQLIGVQIQDNITLPDGAVGLRITWKAEVVMQ